MIQETAMFVITMKDWPQRRERVNSSGLFNLAEMEKEVPDAPKENSLFDIADTAWEKLVVGET